jgi:hypothetical protein
MSEKRHESWRSEFRELGPEGVRREILQRRWVPDKLSAARHWLQFEDIRKWQLHTPAKLQGSSRDFRRWAKYLFAAVLMLFAVARLFRMMRHGM